MICCNVVYIEPRNLAETLRWRPKFQQRNPHLGHCSSARSPMCLQRKDLSPWRAKSKTVLPPKQYPMAAIRLGSTPATRNVADERSGTVISSCLLQLPALQPRLASSKNWVHCYSPKCPLSWGKLMITQWNRMASHFQTNPNSPNRKRNSENSENRKVMESV